jgi:WD40 repeat protein
VAVLDADRIVSGSHDQTLKLWEVSTQRCVGTFQGHSGGIRSVLDADRIVSGSWDNTLKLWEVSTQRCVGTFQGHSSYIYSVAVLDADRIVSGSHDNTLKLWEVPTADPLKMLSDLGSCNDGKKVSKLLALGESDDLEADDVIAVSRLQFCEIVARWGVISSTDFLVTWLLTQCPGLTVEWLTLRSSLAAGLLIWDQVVAHYSRSKGALPQIIMEQLDLSLWSA